MYKNQIFQLILMTIIIINIENPLHATLLCHKHKIKHIYTIIIFLYHLKIYIYILLIYILQIST